MFTRYKEAVQGKELERMFREEGVIDEEEEKEVMIEMVVDDQAPTEDPLADPVKGFCVFFNVFLNISNGLILELPLN